MSAAQVDWSLPVGVLLAGLLLGLVFAWRRRQPPPPKSAPGKSRVESAAAAPAPAPVELRDLEARLEALLAQLRELDDTAAKRNVVQLASERYALELDAARTLQALERHPARRSSTASSHAVGGTAWPAPAGGSTTRGFVWGLVSAVVLVALVVLVQRAAQPRAAGGQPTGDAQRPGEGAGTPQAPAEDPREQAARAAVAANPDDLEARLVLAQGHLRRQDMMGVWNETQYVLQRQPEHAAALAYQALVRLAMGQPEVSVDMLKRALAKDPDLIDAYVNLALVYARIDRVQERDRIMAQALARFPQQRAELEPLFEQVRQVQPAPRTQEPHPHPSTPTTAAARQAEPAAAARSEGPPADSGKVLAGVIELDPGLAGQVNTGATLFVMVREARLQRGPPAAVKRLTAVTFPLRFELGDGDSMAGEPLPDPARIEVRLDGDGNAMTRDPGDPTAVLDEVRAGRRDLRLVLRRSQ